MIKKCGSKWCLWNKAGTKILSKHVTKKDAQKRENQIQYFKSKRNKK